MTTVETLRVIFTGDTGNLTQAINDVAGNLKGLDSSFNKVFDSINTSVRRGGSELSQFAKDVSTRLDRVNIGLKELQRTSLKAFAGFAGSIGLSVKSFGDFEEKMNRFNSIVGSADKGLEEFRKTALEVSKTTKFTASDVAEAGTELAKMGFTAKEAAESIKSIILTSEATGISVSQAASTIGGVLRSFKMDAAQAGVVADVLAQSANKSATSLTTLGHSFKFIGPIAQSTGQSLNDMTGLLSIMGNKMVLGSTAGTNLRQAIVKLVKPSEDASLVLKKLGVNIEDDLGNMNSLPDILNQIRNSMDGMGNATRNAALAQIFGVRAVTGMAAILDSSQDDVEAMISSMEKSTGAAEEMKDIAFRGLNAEIVKLKSTVNTVAIEFGENLAPMAERVTVRIREFVTAFGELPRSVQAGIGQFLVFGGSVTAASVGLTTFMSLVTGTTSSILKLTEFFGFHRKAALASKAANEALAASELAQAGAAGTATAASKALSIQSMATGAVLKLEAAIMGGYTAVVNLLKGAWLSSVAVFNLAKVGVAGLGVHVGVLTGNAGLATAASGAMATSIGAAGTAAAGAATSFGALATSIGLTLLPLAAIAAAVWAAKVAWEEFWGYMQSMRNEEDILIAIADRTKMLGEVSKDTNDIIHNLGIRTESTAERWEEFGRIINMTDKELRAHRESLRGLIKDKEKEARVFEKDGSEDAKKKAAALRKEIEDLRAELVAYGRVLHASSSDLNSWAYTAQQTANTVQGSTGKIASVVAEQMRVAAKEAAAVGKERKELSKAEDKLLKLYIQLADAKKREDPESVKKITDQIKGQRKAYSDQAVTLNSLISKEEDRINVTKELNRLQKQGEEKGLSQRELKLIFDNDEEKREKKRFADQISNLEREYDVRQANIEAEITAEKDAIALINEKNNLLDNGVAPLRTSAKLKELQNKRVEEQKSLIDELKKKLEGLVESDEARAGIIAKINREEIKLIKLKSKGESADSKAEAARLRDVAKAESDSRKKAKREADKAAKERENERKKLLKEIERTAEETVKIENATAAKMAKLNDKEFDYKMKQIAEEQRLIMEKINNEMEAEKRKSARIRSMRADLMTDLKSQIEALDELMGDRALSAEEKAVKNVEKIAKKVVDLTTELATLDTIPTTPIPVRGMRVDAGGVQREPMQMPQRFQMPAPDFSQAQGQVEEISRTFNSGTGVVKNFNQSVQEVNDSVSELSEDIKEVIDWTAKENIALVDDKALTDQMNALQSMEKYQKLISDLKFKDLNSELLALDKLTKLTDEQKKGLSVEQQRAEQNKKALVVGKDGLSIMNKINAVMEERNKRHEDAIYKNKELQLSEEKLNSLKKDGLDLTKMSNDELDNWLKKDEQRIKNQQKLTFSTKVQRFPVDPAKTNVSMPKYRRPLIRDYSSMKDPSRGKAFPSSPIKGYPQSPASNAKYFKPKFSPARQPVRRVDPTLLVKPKQTKIYKPNPKQVSFTPGAGLLDASGFPGLGVYGKAQATPPPPPPMPETDLTKVKQDYLTLWKDINTEAVKVKETVSEVKPPPPDLVRATKEEYSFLKNAIDQAKASNQKFINGIDLGTAMKDLDFLKAKMDAFAKQNKEAFKIDPAQYESALKMYENQIGRLQTIGVRSKDDDKHLEFFKKKKNELEKENELQQIILNTENKAVQLAAEKLNILKGSKGELTDSQKQSKEALEKVIMEFGWVEKVRINKEKMATIDKAIAKSQREIELTSKGLVVQGDKIVKKRLNDYELRKQEIDSMKDIVSSEKSRLELLKKRAKDEEIYLGKTTTETLDSIDQIKQAIQDKEFNLSEKIIPKDLQKNIKEVIDAAFAGEITLPEAVNKIASDADDRVTELNEKLKGKTQEQINGSKDLLRIQNERNEAANVRNSYAVTAAMLQGKFNTELFKSLGMEEGLAKSAAKTANSLMKHVGGGDQMMKALGGLGKAGVSAGRLFATGGADLQAWGQLLEGSMDFVFSIKDGVEAWNKRLSEVRRTNREINNSLRDSNMELQKATLEIEKQVALRGKTGAKKLETEREFIEAEFRIDRQAMDADINDLKENLRDKLTGEGFELDFGDKKGKFDPKQFDAFLDLPVEQMQEKMKDLPASARKELTALVEMFNDQKIQIMQQNKQLEDNWIATQEARKRAAEITSEALIATAKYEAEVLGESFSEIMSISKPDMSPDSTETDMSYILKDEAEIKKKLFKQEQADDRKRIREKYDGLKEEMKAAGATSEQLMKLNEAMNAERSASDTKWHKKRYDTFQEFRDSVASLELSFNKSQIENTQETVTASINGKKQEIQLEENTALQKLDIQDMEFEAWKKIQEGKLAGLDANSAEAILLSQEVSDRTLEHEQAKANAIKKTNKERKEALELMGEDTKELKASNDVLAIQIARLRESKKGELTPDKEKQFAQDEFNAQRVSIFAAASSEILDIDRDEKDAIRQAWSDALGDEKKFNDAKLIINQNFNEKRRKVELNTEKGILAMRKSSLSSIKKDMDERLRILKQRRKELLDEEAEPIELAIEKEEDRLRVIEQQNREYEHQLKQLDFIEKKKLKDFKKTDITEMFNAMAGVDLAPKLREGLELIANPENLPTDIATKETQLRGLEELLDLEEQEIENNQILKRITEEQAREQVKQLLYVRAKMLETTRDEETDRRKKADLDTKLAKTFQRFQEIRIEEIKAEDDANVEKLENSIEKNNEEAETVRYNIDTQKMKLDELKRKYDKDMDFIEKKIADVLAVQEKWSPSLGSIKDNWEGLVTKVVEGAKSMQQQIETSFSSMSGSMSGFFGGDYSLSGPGVLSGGSYASTQTTSSGGTTSYGASGGTGFYVGSGDYSLRADQIPTFSGDQSKQSEANSSGYFAYSDELERWFRTASERMAYHQSKGLPVYRKGGIIPYNHETNTMGYPMIAHGGEGILQKKVTDMVMALRNPITNRTNNISQYAPKNININPVLNVYSPQSGIEFNDQLVEFAEKIARDIKDEEGFFGAELLATLN